MRNSLSFSGSSDGTTGFVITEKELEGSEEGEIPADIVEARWRLAPKANILWSEGGGEADTSEVGRGGLFRTGMGGPVFLFVVGERDFEGDVLPADELLDRGERRPRDNIFVGEAALFVDLFVFAVVGEPSSGVSAQAL